MLKKRFITLIIAAAFAVTGLTGCTFDGKQVIFTTGTMPGTVFRIGKLSCGRKTARVYLANYYNIYGKTGDICLWDQNLNVGRLETNIRKAAIDRLSVVYALNLYADENDVELTDQEESLVEKAAGTYYGSLSASDRKALDVSESDIRDMYEKEALASKVYKKIVSRADDEVSDEEARVMDAVLITFESGDESDAEKAEKELKDGTDISIVAKEYSSDKKINVNICRSTYPAEICNAAFALDEKEYTSPVTTKDGIYIIYCVSKYDEEKSDENRQNIIDSRKQKVMDSIIEEQNRKDYSYIDETAWKEVSGKLGHSIDTDSFFKTLSDNISF